MPVIMGGACTWWLQLQRCWGFWLLLLLLVGMGQGNHDAKRLFDDLLRKSEYNRLIRPVKNSNDSLHVRLGLKLSQIIKVDERNEIVSANVWVVQEWVDHNLRWNPIEYGGVDMLYVPAEDIWLPDIVLYNNADGDFTVAIMTKATLHWYGKVRWVPPAIYKFQCNIDIRYFPFDKQQCKLKFSSWTYDAFKVDIFHISLYPKNDPADYLEVVDRGIDLSEYYRSVEWDLLDIPAKKNVKYYPCCDEPYPDITFNITIRRKTLYYTINLIIPCVALNMLVLLGFYLPCESGEKISICISVLLSLSLFQLLLMELVPATSTATPLLGSYILFTTIVVSISVFSSVVVLNINYRGTTTHVMPRFTKWLLLDTMPKFLFMKRPIIEADSKDESGFDFNPGQSDMASYENPYKRRLTPVYPSMDENPQYPSAFDEDTSRMDVFCDACSKRRLSKYPATVQKAWDGVTFVAKHHKDEGEGKQEEDEWIFAAMVIDRFLLWVYTSSCLVGAMGILLNAPALYDNSPEISELIANEKGQKDL